MANKTVGFYCGFGAHQWKVLPIYWELERRIKKDNLPIDALSGKELTDFKGACDVMIMADWYMNSLVQQGKVSPKTKTIQIGHGLGTKNFYSQGNERWGEFDYICAAGEFDQSMFKQNGISPKKAFWIVGHTQADPLFWNMNGKRYMSVLMFQGESRMRPLPEILFLLIKKRC